MFEHARQFLTKVMPGGIGAGNYLNIHWAGPGTDGKKYWDGRACTTLDDAIRTVAWVQKMGTKDIYVCMSLQGRVENKVSAKGNAYTKAIRFAEDATLLRSLFIDVDVKPEGYQTTKEALAALKKFIKDSGLPMPSAVVSSGGGGFHVHWALDRDITRIEWQPLANALQNCTETLGLKTDSQCTIDAARILRLPETSNHKYDPPRDVTLTSLSDLVSYDVMVAALDQYKGVATVQGNLPMGTGAFGANDDLGAGVVAQMSPEIQLPDVAKNCGFVARALGTGGKDFSQPLWFLSASIAVCVEDGRDMLHAMSDQHPGYSASDVDDLYDRVSATKSQRNIGWPSCEKISRYGCKECATCPHLSLGKSPLNFAVNPTSAAAVDNTLPDRYTRTADNIINARIVADDGSILSLPLCHYPIMSGWLSNDPWTFHFATRTETGKRTVVEVPTEVIFGKEGFSKFLGSKGLFCTEKQYKILKEFFVAWLQKLQTLKDSVISAAPFGWSVVDGKIEGFAYAGRVWMKDSDRPAANPNPVLSYQYTPKGDAGPWKELAKVIYEQDRPALNAILAVAFAAPLVTFTGFPGLLLNAYSPESGIGKTTAMKVSQSVWGNPTLAMQGLSDTSNSVLGKMGQIRSLPMYWDEIKSEAQVKRFCSVVFDLTGGREKTRMNADTTLRQSGTWQTMMVSASNDSIIDGMAREAGSTTAGLHRLFEYAVPKPPKMTKDIGSVQRLAGKLDDNYGHVGLRYAKFIGANWKRVEADVAKIQDALYNETNARQEERMWVATIAVLIKGAEYANEMGMTKIDTAALKDFLLSVLTDMRSKVEESPTSMNNDLSMSSILAEFMNSTRSRNTLITNKLWVGRGKPTKGAIQVQCDTDRLGDIMVQIGTEDRLMRISSVALSRWMSERGYSRHTFVQKMSDEFGMVKMNGKLGSGTALSCAMEHLLELDMNHPKLSMFVE